DMYRVNDSEFLEPFTEKMKKLASKKWIMPADCGGYDKTLQRVQDIMLELRVDKRNTAQLERFNSKNNVADEEILAEAASHYTYLNDPSCDCMIASNDAGFFVPLYENGHISDPVTERIYREFRIVCERPRDILRILKEPF
ncbi:MAG: hypothetical protein OXC46_03195, partial [Thaumarchaeota archaeon]|nr:hypothetical protein [Nitrososphaerota archaeon]